MNKTLSKIIYYLVTVTASINTCVVLSLICNITSDGVNSKEIVKMKRRRGIKK